MARLVLAVVALHAALLVAHDSAHSELGVGLVLWQTVYVYAVIVMAPVVAGGLVFTRHERLAYLLLAISMAGSLVFGVYHHYVAISPDHVGHLPLGPAQPLFRQTALAMVAVETVAAALGVWAYARARSS